MEVANFKVIFLNRKSQRLNALDTFYKKSSPFDRDKYFIRRKVGGRFLMVPWMLYVLVTITVLTS